MVCLVSCAILYLRIGFVIKGGAVMSGKTMSRSDLLKLAGGRFLMGLFVLAAIFFLTAWSFSYWQAWMYLATLFIPMFMLLIYLVFNAPDLLERRMHAREQVTEQKWIIAISTLLFIPAFILPGFDIRFGWSKMPAILSVASDVLVFLGYTLFIIVLRENHYASRIVEVEQNQKVISSGPYAIVRHPMYVAVILMYVFTPLALGSYWGIIPALTILPSIFFRIRSEEKVLASELEGYVEYTQKVRHRLIPGVW